MDPVGIPSRLIGTETRLPGHLNGRFGVEQIPYLHFTPPDPTFSFMSFNYDTDIARMTKDNPVVQVSTDLSAFKNRGGKIIYYHGISDPGPVATNTLNYYESIVELNGGIEATQSFAKLFLIPNMGHCRGGSATDQFDLLTPLVDWVENGIAPDSVVASGDNFATAPTSRSRPLCPYPQTARYIGPVGGDISLASNYACQ